MTNRGATTFGHGIRKTRCDGFGTGVCWMVEVSPLWGCHYRSWEEAWRALMRARGCDEPTFQGRPIVEPADGEFSRGYDDV